MKAQATAYATKRDSRAAWKLSRFWRQSCIYRLFYIIRLHWQMKKLPTFPAAKRSRLVLVNVKIRGGETVSVVDHGFKKGRR